MIGGEAIDLGAPPTPSGETRPPFWKPRVTMKTWSRESTHVPPISPVTQPLGSGLGQKGSATNRGESRPERLAVALIGCDTIHEATRAIRMAPT
jgi:hypothetical protein